MSALSKAVREIESHAAAAGWDQPAQLFALVPTADLLAVEPGLAETLGDEDGLTAVQQEPIGTNQTLEEVLARIEWPEAVEGCAAVVERLVLPPDADEQIPEDADAATAYAAEHPDREEVRIVAAATRNGEAFCALRLRAHDEDESVVVGPDLVPALIELLHATLETHAPGEDI